MRIKIIAGIGLVLGCGVLSAGFRNWPFSRNVTQGRTTRNITETKKILQAPQEAPKAATVEGESSRYIQEFRNYELINIDTNGKIAGFDQALEQYLNSVGRDVNLIFMLGNEYFMLGKYEKAFKVFSKGASYMPNLFGAATTARLTGNFQTAVDYYDQLLENRSNMPEAWLGRGLAHRALKNYSNAISDLNNYLNYRKDESVYLGIGGIYIEIEDYVGAYETLLNGKRAFPSSKGINDMLSKVTAKLN
ncbi:MAG: tetratricopeptide repeat protein [Fusobacteriaceae bacterium]|jgi:tetratricopeptide (TPR) repeat protein|nr:tetratricopeptide repeat protein [Fusobacteriaceae bacterium]